MGIPSQSNYDKLHAKKVEQYTRKVRGYYLQTIKAIANLAPSLNLSPNAELYFKNNPEVAKKIDTLLNQLNSKVYGTTVEGINSEWDLAVEKNNEIAKAIYGKALDELPIQYRDKYFSNNAKARQNFVNRKINGLGLSDRVWNNTQQFKSELELALEHGIGKGQPASLIAKNIQEYLNDPDKLFRRIRDKENGALRLSKAAKAYNPGQGRYRSSYKNAMRLTRNEINFSYEGSQYEKRKQQDFIVGVEVRVSPSHKASDDAGGISCLSLQGVYPKTFNFTYKWHVNCKCMTLNVLKTKEELNQDIDKILSGGAPSNDSTNKVDSTPSNYNTYLKENEKKWKDYKTPPRTFTLNKDIT